MQLSSRILTALAVLILAVTVVAVRAGSPGTLEAATGTIDVVNVGTCYTTNDDAFNVGDCLDGDDDVEDGEDATYQVGDGKTITEVDSVYATYAIDPKTSGDAPRAILKYADLIKISIEDKDRDKRTGVLFPVGQQTVIPEIRTEIRMELGEPRSADLLGDHDTDGDGATATSHEVMLTSERELAASAVVFTGPTIGSSGLAQFLLTEAGSNDYPMAPEGDGDVFWFGTVNGGEFRNLEDYVELDEDLSTGEAGDLAPWMRVSASVPDGVAEDVGIVIQYIYYQTSQQEEIVGGKTNADYNGEDGNPLGEVKPKFVDAEARAANPQALSLSASADGDEGSQNLWLKETERFSGVYVGYLRLTDANGAGLDEKGKRQDWGRETQDATGHGYADADGNDIAAVLGVVGGPVNISYTDSNGDKNTIQIQIDTVPPVIELDNPVNGVSSKDDSPDVFGRFTDGDSGLRADSFKLYADNRDDNNDDQPVWEFYVNELAKDTSGVSGVVLDEDRGYVCVDAKVNAANEDACEPDGVAGLRGHYSGFSDALSTFGIIKSGDVYLDPEQDAAKDDEDDFKVADAESYDDGAEIGEFDDVVRIDFPADNNNYNHTIDIQAVVLDRAGNYGFSDSENSDPTFIHDFGTKKGQSSTDRDDDDKHNVLGWYSRHVYRLDDVDPAFSAKQSATGFFTDEDGDAAANRSGVMVVFDGDIAEASVGTDSFTVQLDNGSEATITHVDVDGDKVYLLLEETLEPNETPFVELAAGKSVVDLAGNESTARRLEGFTLNDGILPTFTVTLSGGSGLNEDIDGEGPSELTNKTGILISITSDEDIQGAPKFAVVCEKLTWGDPDDENDVATFAKNRKGPIGRGDIDEKAPIDDDANAENGDTACASAGAYFDVAVTSAHARRGNLWQFEWSNLTGESQMLDDGTLAVIVWGRDIGSYESGNNETLHNFSSTTVNFGYDTVLKAAWGSGEDSELVPVPGDDVFEPRPFVLLAFGDETITVDVTTFEVDGIDYTSDLQILEGNEFVWWPEPLALGTYDVYVEANDAANNTDQHTYSFTVKERAPFVLDLLAGWNSISFPANPIDRALHAVFTEEAVDQVIGWNATEAVSPWRMATRVDGVWTTNDEYATLNDVEGRYGYWIHSKGFVTQAVQLAGQTDRSFGGQPNPANIPTEEGWNFVGVVDVDGDQTQDDAGETLRNSNNDPITATEYLGNYTRAYTWDHINNTWDIVKANEGITIGTGVWVYYTKDQDIAP